VFRRFRKTSEKAYKVTCQSNKLTYDNKLGERIPSKQSLLVIKNQRFFKCHEQLDQEEDHCNIGQERELNVSIVELLIGLLLMTRNHSALLVGKLA